ncbi:Hsp70 family protein [Halobacillus trueperi]|uniref:Hsp70 family protein n=1 Tax=Halobacillus trueperi TaxID=156205 RepID=UPI003735BAA1
MDIIYGIDLGTSNCLAAKATKVFDQVEIDCLIDDFGNESFPSVVHFSDEENIIVGEKAKRLLPDYPEATAELVKLLLGKEREVKIFLGGVEKNFSPQEISALLLRHFNYLHQNNIKRAVLTVPAYFDDNKKAATLQAGELAGIEIVELIEEPSAAIMYHLFDHYHRNNKKLLKKGEEKNYLVFDFGGGTLDLSFIKVELDDNNHLKPTVQIKEGDTELGGNLIDLEFTKLILEYLDEDYDDPFTNSLIYEFKYYYNNGRFRMEIDNEVKEFIIRLKNTLEHVKIKLSFKESELIEFGILEYENYNFTREEFEEDILEVFFRDRVLEILSKIKEKNRNNDPIDEVILVGGTSQIPYFRNLISIHFPELKDNIVVSGNYENAIAMGASILGAIISGTEVAPFGKNRCYNIVSHNILVNDSLFINYGTKFPFAEPEKLSFEIEHALQTKISINISEQYESYNSSLKKRELQSRTIKKLNFYHPFFYKGEELSISLEINDHGLLYFNAIHETTKENIDFEADKMFQLEDHELDEATSNIKKYHDII